MRRLSVLLAGLLVAACTPTSPPNHPSSPSPLAGPVSRMPPPDWSTYENPTVGFGLIYPPGWAVRTVDAICSDGLFTSQGVVVANTDDVFPAEPPDCGRVWEQAGEDSVVVQFRHQAISREGPDPEPDSAFPLSLDDAPPYQDPMRFDPGTHRQLDVSLGGDSGYVVVVWHADGAAADDLAAADRIVASISFPRGPLLEVPERLRKRVVAEGTAWEGENQSAWRVLVYWRTDDGWCVRMDPLGVMCEHEETTGATRPFNEQPFLMWGPWLARSGPQGAAFGTVSGAVETVRFEFEDGEQAEADIYSPPDDIGVSFRLFVYTRTDMPPGRVLALDAAGHVLAVQEFR